MEMWGPGHYSRTASPNWKLVWYQALEEVCGLRVYKDVPFPWGHICFYLTCVY
jgi:hypothetical protein